MNRNVLSRDCKLAQVRNVSFDNFCHRRCLHYDVTSFLVNGKDISSARDTVKFLIGCQALKFLQENFTIALALIFGVHGQGTQIDNVTCSVNFTVAATDYSAVLKKSQKSVGNV